MAMRKFWRLYAQVGEIVTIHFGGREYVGEVIEKSVDVPNNNGIKIREIKQDDKGQADYTGNIVCIPITQGTVLVAESGSEADIGDSTKKHEPKKDSVKEEKQGEEEDD